MWATCKLTIYTLLFFHIFPDLWSVRVRCGMPFFSSSSSRVQREIVLFQCKSIEKSLNDDLKLYSRATTDFSRNFFICCAWFRKIQLFFFISSSNINNNNRKAQINNDKSKNHKIHSYWKYWSILIGFWKMLLALSYSAIKLPQNCDNNNAFDSPFNKFVQRPSVLPLFFFNSVCYCCCCCCCCCVVATNFVHMNIV